MSLQPFRPWTRDDIGLLFKLAAEGLSDRAIGERLGRTTFAVGKKRKDMHISIVPSGRIENEQPWEPLAGMIKRRCERCNYWFATPQDAQRGVCPLCPRGK